METNPDLEYLRTRLDELWSKVYERENKAGNAVAFLNGWKPAVDAALQRLDERLFALALEGPGKRLEQIESRLNTLEQILAAKALRADNPASPVPPPPGE